MAIYSVGQRVRIIRIDSDSDRFNGVIGRAGVVVRVGADEPHHYPYIVRYEGAAIEPNHYGPNHAAFKAEHLAPLTDPRAEEFIGDMNRFAIAAAQTIKERT